VLGLGLYLANQSKDVNVPDLTGKTAAEAGDLLAKAGLTANQQPANNCPAASQGKIISQSPKANTSVDEGSEVTYQLCQAPNKTTVPPLVGKSRADAEKALAAANLRGNFVAIDSAAPKDQVVATDPGAGQTVDPNSTVTVNISKFNQREVPDLTGKSESEARQALAAKGFTNIRVARQNTNDAGQVDKVIKQDPAAKSVVAQNVTITITLGQRQNNPPTQQPSASTSASAGTGG
jgi:serine/threonine-protein kinase